MIENTEKKVDFMRLRKAMATMSAALILISIFSLAVNKLEFGLDFTGGSLVELEFSESVELGNIRDILSQAEIKGAVVQHFGRSTDVVIRVPPETDKAGESIAETGAIGEKSLGLRIFESIQSAKPDTQLLRNDFVGPQIGSELRDEGGIAMLVALGCMLMYVGFRFKFKFGVGAVLALFHDVIIVLGIFSLFSLPFDQSVLAAILAVIGYSLNDTIVVSDRIRENFRELPEGSSIEIINDSLNQTLSRTLVTSVTTMLVLFALLIFGGEAIRYFAVALMLGVVVGTYSSIYVASNVLCALNLTIEDFIEPVAEAVDDMP